MIEILKRLLVGRIKIGSTYYETQNEWLRSVLSEVVQGSKVLDAGAGELRNKTFCAHLNYFSQDNCEYAGGEVGEIMQTGSWDTSRIDIVSDIGSIPVDDNSFDVVLCTEVFEHLPNPLLALKEFSRILQCGGQLIITAPFNSLTHFAPFHFATGFNKYYYMHHLPTFGFEIVHMSTNGNYFDYLAQEIRRVNHITNSYSSTRLRFFEKFVLYLCLRIFGRIEKHDKASADVLCSGYHVVAKLTKKT